METIREEVKQRQPAHSLKIAQFEYIQPTLKDVWFARNRYTYMTLNGRSVCRHPIPSAVIVNNIKATIKRIHSKENVGLVKQLAELRDIFRSRQQLGTAERKLEKQLSLLVFDEAYVQNRTARSETISRIKTIILQNKRLVSYEASLRARKSTRKVQAQLKATAQALVYNEGEIKREKEHLKVLNATHKKIKEGYNQ